jgi:hypothetical protein
MRLSLVRELAMLADLDDEQLRRVFALLAQAADPAFWLDDISKH